MSEFYVYTALEPGNIYAGKCYYTVKSSGGNNPRVSSLFSYSEEYLSENPCRNIDPSLILDTGAQRPVSELHGAFRDSAPDRWGRMLIDHMYHRKTAGNGKPARALSEVDYLLGVSDLTRQGALRYSLSRGGDFERQESDVPKLVELPKLYHAAQLAVRDNEEEAIRLLIEAGSASLGGARPKAAVRDGNKLYMAKFPHRHDEWDVIAWEWAAMKTAGEVGITVPKCELISIEKKSVLISERFDRSESGRIGYISAMTLLGKEDGGSADYEDIALRLMDVSESPKDDLEQLFRRILFSVIINNTDDHLRNHGFLMHGSAWKLSPAFDLNPNPQKGAPRATSVFGETTSRAAEALEKNAGVFGLSGGTVSRIKRDLSGAKELMISFAGKAGVSKSEQKVME